MLFVQAVFSFLEGADIHLVMDDTSDAAKADSGLQPDGKALVEEYQEPIQKTAQTNALSKTTKS